MESYLLGYLTAATAANLVRSLRSWRRTRAGFGIAAMALVLALTLGPGAIQATTAAPPVATHLTGAASGPGSALGAASSDAGSSAAMSPAATAYVLTSFSRALATGESGAGYLASTVVLTLGASGREIQGRDAVAAIYANLCHNAFAGRMTVTERMAGGGIAAERGEFTGTLIAAYAGVAPTGQTVSVAYMTWYELAAGQITAIRIEMSSAEMMVQLATPPTAPAPTGRPGTAF